MITEGAITLRSRRRKSAGQESPEWVRISMASAIALGFRSGRFSREFDFGGINLLLNYDDGCRSDCGYCGLARTRPGNYEDKSFIRVEWPLVRTGDLVARMAKVEEKLTRLCISMVTSPYAFDDTLEITSMINGAVATPLSILVAPPTLNRRRLERFREAGADMIGIGLDAVTEELFRSVRTDVPAGGAGLSWDKYWSIVEDARELFGPWKVNCHTVVGLGETDQDLVGIFLSLVDREIFPYLFCFNPEPESRMGGVPKTGITRWRRIQLAKHLIETEGFTAGDFSFDGEGNLSGIRNTRLETVEAVASEGSAFMTNGCPGERGEPGCTRPYGSYRPTEEFRDFPFEPTEAEISEIKRELQIESLF